MSGISLQKHSFDVIVLGAGGAGLRAACEAARHGANVACLSKVPPTRSHTVAAQGGINAALGNRSADNWRWHMYDTIRGSDWLGDQDAIAFMCENAPAAIYELEQMGMAFSRQPDGRIYQRAYGGQRANYGKGDLAYRACAVADRTGHALLHTLYQQALQRKVTFMVEWIALDLLFDHDGTCCGLLAWELATGDIHLLSAHCIIIATGGYGQAYASTTSSTICTGDGGGMAMRAGLPMQDMEFVQFHPTGLYGTGILITEGARGEGGFLLNGQGERFMQHYAPTSLDLASRDVISRAMIHEIRDGRGCGDKKDHLHLSLTHLEPSLLREKLPAICDIARRFLHMDPATSPIPVLPAVHYTMGGIASNASSEVIRLNADGSPEPLEGLRVVGEAACNSVHGANRLGCNSLLDLVVFGKSAGEAAAQSAKKAASQRVVAPASLEVAVERLEKFRRSKGHAKPPQLRNQMQAIMQEHAGIFREAEPMQQGLQKLQALWSHYQNDLGVHDTSLLWNNSLLEAYELDSLLRQSIATLASAIRRTESRGAHARNDYPKRNDAEWLCHSLCWLDDAGNAHFARRDVNFTMTEDKNPAFQPEERMY